MVGVCGESNQHNKAQFIDTLPLFPLYSKQRRAVLRHGGNVPERATTKLIKPLEHVGAVLFAFENSQCAQTRDNYDQVLRLLKTQIYTQPPAPNSFVIYSHWAEDFKPKTTTSLPGLKLTYSPAEGKVKVVESGPGAVSAVPVQQAQSLQAESCSLGREFLRQYIKSLGQANTFG